MQFIFCVLWFDFQRNTEVLVWKSVQHKEEKFFEITVHLNVAHLTVRSPGNTPCCWAVLVNTPLQHYMRVGYSASGFVNLGLWVQTLLSLPEKVYVRILKEKLHPIVKSQIQSNSVVSILVMQHWTSSSFSPGCVGVMSPAGAPPHWKHLTRITPVCYLGVGGLSNWRTHVVLIIQFTLTSTAPNHSNSLKVLYVVRSTLQ